MAQRDIPPKGLTAIEWRYAYKTSQSSPDGGPVDILHDFYVPALRHSVRYDRVAGYFRSTSLAAASQGFSAFTTAGGRMRMVVGADLDPKDVAAILAGDSERLADLLSRQIEIAADWPDEVQRGVQLLAWMVAKGHLAIRVAFRVHGETRKPVSFDDCSDGYVHEKWAVFADADGNRLYVSGSLNESRTALVLNAENIDVHADWWGGTDGDRVDDADTHFARVWNNEIPHLVVMTLPEAVKKKLIKIGEAVTAPVEIDGSTAVPPEVPPPSALERLRFAVIKDGPRLPYGRYVGMETAPVEPWPHQEVVARRLVETWPYTYLLCDEVGLGNTIEAGLAIRSLVLCGLVKRVLISPPASLTRQWQREMASKFLLPFARALTGTEVRHEVIFPRQETRSGNNLYAPDLSIVSTGLLSRQERRVELQSAGVFDIALVDEAHYARRKNPKNGTRSHPRFGGLYRVIDDVLRPRSTSLWLATATPMQLDWIEVFDLLRLTDRVGPFQHDPSLTWCYYESLGKLVHGKDIDDHYWEFLRRSIDSLPRHDPFLWAFLEQAVIDGRIRITAQRWLDSGHRPVGRDKRLIQRLIFSAAPLSRVMLRHTRRLLEIYREKGMLQANLPERVVLPVPRIVMNTEEKRAYDELEDYCRDLAAQIAAYAQDPGWKTSLGFYLSFLRLRFASSLYAIRETIRRRRQKVTAALSQMGDMSAPDKEIDILDATLGEEGELDEEAVLAFLKNRTPEDLRWERKRLSALSTALDGLGGRPSKMQQLLKVLQDRRTHGGRIRQTVIFTRFYDTLKDIVRRLRRIDAAMLIGTYSGKGGQYVDPQTKKMVGVERDEIKHRFMRQELDVLVCTDAAAEGLNLQTADYLINYDLPWNPMKVEQRIGRIDRIGQKHDKVSVLNLCYVDSAEQIVYDRLLQRLRQAGYVVGTQQFSLLPISTEEFADLAAGKLSAQKLEATAKERMEIQRRQTTAMEIPAEDLYEIYGRLANSPGQDRAPVTLGAIWQALAGSQYLRDKGCTALAEDSGKTLTLRGIDTVADNTVLTVDRQLYETGLPDPRRPVRFASHGDPAFDALLETFDTFELPACVARITATVPNTHAQVVGYAAACVNDEGDTKVKLITSWRDVQDIRLDESAELREEHLKSARNELDDLVRVEFDATRSVRRLERDNRRAGRCQFAFDLLCMRSLLNTAAFANYDEDDSFWSFVNDRLDDLIRTRSRLLVSKLPVAALKRIRNDLLLDLRLPQVARETTIEVPIVYVKAAVDAGCRIAEAMKAKRSELRIGRVRSSMERELEKVFKHL